MASVDTSGWSLGVWTRSNELANYAHDYLSVNDGSMRPGLRKPGVSNPRTTPHGPVCTSPAVTSTRPWQGACMDEHIHGASLVKPTVTPLKKENYGCAFFRTDLRRLMLSPTLEVKTGVDGKAWPMWVHARSPGCSMGCRHGACQGKALQKEKPFPSSRTRRRPFLLFFRAAGTDGKQPIPRLTARPPTSHVSRTSLCSLRDPRTCTWDE